MVDGELCNRVVEPGHHQVATNYQPLTTNYQLRCQTYAIRSGMFDLFIYRSRVI